MSLIGEIARLQVQVGSLKVGDPPRRRYDLAGLRSVPALRIEPGGVFGLLPSDEWAMDVHHRDHPAAKHRPEDGNGLSLGFTSHYRAMRARFGDHLADGDAAENILVATDQPWSEADLAAGLEIVTGSGERVRLERIVVATPCVEFTRFALRFPDEARPDRRVTEAVGFLDGGMRGYYATPAAAGAELRVGDQVLLAASGGDRGGSRGGIGS